MKLFFGAFAYAAVVALMVVFATSNGDAQKGATFEFVDTSYSTEAHAFVAPGILQNGDVTGDGKIDMDDITYLIDYVFTGGPMPERILPDSVRQASVRVRKGFAVIDTEGDTLLYLDVTEYSGGLFYVPGDWSRK